MKQRPILFSGPMVRALLDGSKTQTRRVMKPQPEPTPGDYPGPKGHWWPAKSHQTMLHVESEMQKWTGLAADACPHGQPGGQLWVREAFRFEAIFDNWKPSAMPPSSGIWYEANGVAPEWMGKLRPSMFMPRWASRITLEITSVRVERLQEISEADALAEGADMDQMVTMPMSPSLPVAVSLKPRSTIEAYAALWESINGSDSWAANPWVWVIEFKRLKGSTP